MEGLDDGQKELVRNSRYFEVAASRDNRKLFFINCWHLNPAESAAMWKLAFVRSSITSVTRGPSAKAFGIEKGHTVVFDAALAKKDISGEGDTKTKAKKGKKPDTATIVTEAK